MPTALGPAILASAGIGAGGSLVSGLIGSGAAQTASQQQAAIERQALAFQQQMFDTSQGNLKPFITEGQTAGGILGGLLPTLTTPYPSLQPFNPTMQQLEQTPGYQFTLGQGLQATQNSYAAQGLGSSGAALKGAANYAEGLAGTTFQQQFENYLQQQQQGFNQYQTGNQNIYNYLAGQQGVGASAGAALGGIGTNISGQVGSTLGTIGGALASGTVGSANALTQGLQGIGSSIGSALPAYALAPLTTAALASVPGMYTNPGSTLYPGATTNTGLPF